MDRKNGLIIILIILILVFLFFAWMSWSNPIYLVGAAGFLGLIIWFSVQINKEIKKNKNV